MRSNHFDAGSVDGNRSGHVACQRRAKVGPVGLWVGVLFLMLIDAAAGQPSGPNGNLPLPPETLRRRLQDDAFDITSVAGAGGGIMGAQKLGLVFRSDGVVAEAKWKKAPSDGEGWNNTPRRELAAYVAQTLFLDPDDYVVPPIAMRCIPLDVYRPVDHSPSANLPNTRCVFGTLSAWLRNVHMPKEALQPERFARDRRYDYYAGNLNLFTYLVEHRDAKASNFLISDDPARPQLFSVDNGISFGGAYNPFVQHFDRFEVGGVPRRAVDRLRRVTPADLARFGVLGEFRPDANGVLLPVTPSPNADPKAGVRTVNDGIQFGLTAEEIDGVASRLHALFERIDRGELTVF